MNKDQDLWHLNNMPHNADIGEDLTSHELGVNIIPNPTQDVRLIRAMRSVTEVICSQKCIESGH